jgi:PLP dependent protein
VDDASALAHARDRVLQRIRAACERVGRDPASVTLVAVSKTVPADRLRAAVAAGLDLLGENRVQEALGKIPDVPGARWHLVGPLQSNKVRRAITAFAVIETVDSVGLARRIASIARDEGVPEPCVLLQVNVDADPAKAGFAPRALEAAIPELSAIEGLRVEGVMTVGRLVERAEAARTTFRALRDLSAAVRERWPALGPELSMGMTDDFEVAIEEGATIVRVGRALFGERPHTHEHAPDEAEHTH